MKNNRKAWIGGALAMAGALGAGAANAGDVRWSIGVHLPVHPNVSIGVSNAPVYAAPPVYVAPPVYAAPPIVYVPVAPRVQSRPGYGPPMPVYVAPAPAPVVVPLPVYGHRPVWRDGRRHDGRWNDRRGHWR